VAFVIGTLLDMIDSHQGIAAFDKSVSEWGSHHASSRTVEVLKFITHFGETWVVIGFLILVAVYDYVRHRNFDVVLFLSAVMVGESLINNGLKHLVARERPDVLRLVQVSGSSFPSGHSATAAAGAAAAALVLSRDRRRMVRALAAAIATLIAIAVATSRALLGVHWLTDVLGGLTVGWGWFLFVAMLFGGRWQRLGDPAERAKAAEPPSPSEAASAASERTEIKQ
jgi:undecaprenyl-diphosphatase